MALLDLINLRKVRKAILYIFCLAVAVWLQFTVLSRAALPDFAGGRLKPFFLPAAVAAIGLWEGGVWGGMFGLALGIYCDLNMAESTVMFLILFSALGFFSGVLADYLINRRFVAYLFLSAAALVLTALCQTVPLWIFHGASLLSLLPVALLQALWSLPFAVPVYFAIRAVARTGRNTI